MSEIRVLVVDDHAILRDGIRSLLERQSDITVVGEATNGREALTYISEFLPDIVLMDIAMPDMDGMEATHQIKKLYPEIRVLILTQYNSREYIDPLLKAGASGYVLKNSGGRELISAIRHVAEEGAFLEPRITRQVLQSYSRDDGHGEKEIPHLTSREHQILKLVSTGKSNKEIAQILYISPKTVSVHRSNIMKKLGVHNSFELIRYVIDLQNIN